MEGRNPGLGHEKQPAPTPCRTATYTFDLCAAPVVDHPDRMGAVQWMNTSMNRIPSARRE